MNDKVGPSVVKEWEDGIWTDKKMKKVKILGGVVIIIFHWNSTKITKVSL